MCGTWGSLSAWAIELIGPHFALLDIELHGGLQANFSGYRTALWMRVPFCNSMIFSLR
jgi:hypothetical protein